ncbi:UDP-glucose/GDP-mannose dehydrogenase family protein [Acidocella sp.]|uniref:UDP-glucose dehydrogenase family protein n=2 Tax=Acidocella sp. TaxID=50710 RepID=UPI00261ACC65|nr:UDP-glucose/GDP-mannose dehydrogenase family protein [Acidocella sp.]
MRIVMIGAGYVGLVSGACFASLGTGVTIVEKDPARLAALREGHIPIYEPGLERLVADATRTGHLRFEADLEAALPGADAVFLAVGTPSRRGDGHADLSHVFAAAAEVAAALTAPTVLVTKSTVPVGTGRRLSQMMREVRPGLAIHIASNPEFLREGSAIEDFLRPERIVIGTDSPAAREVLEALYHPLTEAGAALFCTGRETAELIKYATNAFLALKITFANEMADLCEQVGADIHELAHGMGQDSRIGPKFLQPGPGFGGSCFPKDTQALMRIAQDAQAPSRLVETVVAVNDARKAAMAGRILKAFGGSVRRRRVAVLGLTFKPDTDDMRESPAIPILHRLAELGAEITAYDPAGMAQARGCLPEAITYAPSAAAAVHGADGAVLITEWAEFRTLDPAWLAQTMRGRVVVDLRNVFDAKAMRRAGLEHHAIGRPAPAGLPAAPPAEAAYCTAAE